MGRIVVSDNISLDGVIQDPAGDEGFWVGQIKDRLDMQTVDADVAFLIHQRVREASSVTYGHRSQRPLAETLPVSYV
jgi:hypothetical protein